MSKKTISIILLGLIYLIFALDFVANYFFLYWRFWWFDIVMHFLGGGWVSLSAIYLFTFYKHKILRSVSLFTFSLLTLFTVGILWEVFEYFTGVSLQQTNYVLDTSLDILMDFLGWLVVYSSFFPKLKRKKIAKSGDNDKMSVDLSIIN